jgi:hypothetical protein
MTNAREFDRDMHQINIQSMDVLMQLVQIVEGIQGTQLAMQETLAHLAHGRADAARDTLDAVRERVDETSKRSLALPAKLGPLVASLHEANARYGA